MKVVLSRPSQYGRKVGTAPHYITVCGLYVGSQLNRQHVPSVDHNELARETERLDRRCIYC